MARNPQATNGLTSKTPADSRQLHQRQHVHQKVTDPRYPPGYPQARRPILKISIPADHHAARHACPTGLIQT